MRKNVERGRQLANSGNKRENMEKGKRVRYIAFECLLPGHVEWGVLDRETNELVETADEIEKYPEAWAQHRADKLNKDLAK